MQEENNIACEFVIDSIFLKPYNRTLYDNEITSTKVHILQKASKKRKNNAR